MESGVVNVGLLKHDRNYDSKTDEEKTYLFKNGWDRNHRLRRIIERHFIKKDNKWKKD